MESVAQIMGIRHHDVRRCIQGNWLNAVLSISSATSLRRDLRGAGENIETKPFPKMQKVNEDPIFT